jgi:flavin-dependent dehydrogenase
VDPVLCEGISFAIRTGQLAAEAALTAGGEPARTAEVYGRRLAGEILPEIRAGRLLASLLYDSPRLSGWLFGRWGDALCRAVTEVVAGSGPIGRC